MSRYVNIATRIWHDEKFRELPDDAKMLFVYLLTCPHGNMCGLFYLPALYACHDLGWTEERLSQAMGHLQGIKVIEYDNELFMLHIVGHFGKKSKRPSPWEWAKLRKIVFKRDNHTCSYCGKRGVRLECDHIIPVSLGGSNKLDNLTTACVRCNRQKGAKSPEEWGI